MRAKKSSLEIKVIALDVYGTILATDDPDNELPPRKGLLAFLEKCKKLGITLCTSSDGETISVKANLEEAGVNLTCFDRFFQMQQGAAKNYTPILDHYRIDPKQLLVIGNSLPQDIEPAMQLGCRTEYVDDYYGANDNTDCFSKIKLR